MSNTKIYDLPESTSLDTNAVVPVVDFVGWLPVSRKVKASALGNGGSVPTKATGAEITTGTDDTKFATPKALKDAWVTPILVKATSSDVTTGTDDAKYTTAKSIKDAGIVAVTLPVKATWTEVNTWTDDAKFMTPKSIADSSYTKSALPLAWWTMTGKVTTTWHDEVGKTYTPATGSQTVTIDCSVNNIHIVSWHASGTTITFAISNCTNSQPFIISILQGWTTVSTITAWFSTVRWAWWIAPTLTATLNKRDTFGFIRTWANTYDWFIIWQNC